MIVAGRINKLFGVEGSLMVSLYDAFPEDFDPQTTPFFVEIDSLEVPLWCDDFERHGISSAIVRFADFDTERRAEELLGRTFSMEDPYEVGNEDDEEFYLEDLIGFRVDGIEIGEGGEHRFEALLSDYYDSDQNPLFELEIDQRKVLIPAQEEFLAHIDFEEQRMKIVLPEGLLDLE